MEAAKVWDSVRSQSDALVSFAQRLVRTESLSGREGEVAALVAGEMEHLDYSEVSVDEAGNVIGRLGGGDAPSLMLNGHIDHVAAGDPGRWPHPPYSAEVRAGELWGRGTVDMKGAVAAMVYAGGIIQRLGLTPPGDLYVTAAVQEEVGGLGSRHMSRTLRVDRAVVGEASGNHLRRGHRGRVELMARFCGRPVHASMPHLGINPHFSMACFVEALGEMDMATAPVYGRSTVAPTRVTCSPQDANVTPSKLDLVLDWRNIPGEGPDEIVDQLRSVLRQSLQPNCEATIEIATKDLVSYKGFRMTYPDVFPSFTTREDHPWLVQSQAVLAGALGREVLAEPWPFATDGGHFAAEGATVLGFGPGDAALVHTEEERIPIDQLVESVVGYVALCMT